MAPQRDWRRMHHSPWFWLGAVVFLVAITIYVASLDLSWRPRRATSSAAPYHSVTSDRSSGG